MRRACSVNGVRSSPWRARAQRANIAASAARGSDRNRDGLDEGIDEFIAMRGAVALPRLQAMRGDRGKYDLYMFGQHGALALHQRPGLGGAQQSLRGTRRQAEFQLAADR